MTRLLVPLLMLLLPLAAASCSKDPGTPEALLREKIADGWYCEQAILTYTDGWGFGDTATAHNAVLDSLKGTLADSYMFLRDDYSLEFNGTSGYWKLRDSVLVVRTNTIHYNFRVQEVNDESMWLSLIYPTLGLELFWRRLYTYKHMSYC